jgi:hypothetical protein
MLTVVTGAPCSGKTTYVRQHAHPGDVIVDFDAIAQALGSQVEHGHGNAHWKVAIEARDAAITAAVGCHEKGARAWIIDSRPTQAKRDWYRRHGGRIVDLAADAAELHRRADAAGRPQSWHGQIDTFLAGSAVQVRTQW